MPIPLPRAALGESSACVDGCLSTPKRLTFPGRPEQVPATRAFVTRVLGENHPGAERATLLTSELVTNSVRHSRSRRAGGTITVTLVVCAHRVRVEVRDEGAATLPKLQPDDELAENGRGLRLVNAYSLAWDYYQTETGTVTWFECRPAPLP